ncbi:MAG: YbaB/EbfC family nucleoid-associated protein [Coxiellaceae bacterium]|nr:YbaB/EbfC family nucleoid-associated protein [Coxiellaceae bacterium]
MGFNMGGLGNLMKNAGKIQEMMKQQQEELEKIQVTGEAGAGDVQVTMTAKHYVLKIDIKDEILKEDKEIVEDLIAAATNDATAKVEKITQEKMSGLGQMFGVDMPTDDDSK